MPPAVDLALALAIGRAAWPGVEVPEAAFRAAVERALGDGGGELAGADLYLATACAAGAPAALEAFRAAFLDGVERFVAPIDPRPEVAEDVRQTLLPHLLAPGAGGAPKIAEYSGRGPLAAWVRMVAVRLALLQRRAAQRLVPLDVEVAARAVDALADPELEHIRAMYRDEVQAAMVEALRALAPEQRTVLRLHHVEGLRLEAVAAMLGVSRATAHRRIAEARAAAAAELRRRLEETLGARPLELESILRLVRSDLDASIGTALAGSGDR